MKLPFDPTRHFDWDKSPRATAVVTWLAGIVGSTFLAQVIVIAAATAITLAANYLLRPDAPKPKEQGTFANFRSAVYSSEIVYGQIRKGGPITYMESTKEDNRFLHLIIVLAGHRVEEIGDIYVDDQVVTLSGTNNGFVNDDRWRDPDTNNRMIYIRKFDGQDSQNIRETLKNDPESRGIASQMDDNFQGKGIACLYVQLKYNTDVFTSGVPSFSAVVKGKRVWDPRVGASSYSNNAALVIRDYLRNDYGLNTPASTIDDAAFEVAADDCDESVTLAGGGTQPRYTIDGIVSTGTNIGGNLNELVASTGGMLYYSQGKFSLKVGVWNTPVKDLTLDDIVGPINLSTRSSRRDNFNAVYGSFPRAGDDWIYTDYPPVKSSVFLAEDGGYENPATVDFNYITNSRRVQRVAKLILYKAREQMVFSADFGMNAFDLEIGDNVRITIDKYGWTNKEFEVISWKLSNDNNAGDLRVSMTLRETSEASYEWNAEEQDLISNDSNLPDPTFVPDVGLSLDTTLRIINEEVFGVILAEVESDSDFANLFEVQYKKSSDTDWVTLGTSKSQLFEIVPAESSDYDVRARAINIYGRKGTWATTSNFTADPLGDPPDNVTDFSVNFVGGIANLSWAPVPDLDLSHYQIKYSPETSGVTWATSVDLIEKVARPATNASTPGRTGTYLIKAVDKLGNKSPVATSTVITVDLDDVLNLNVVATVTEHPDFGGTFTDTLRTVDGSGTPYITLDGTGDVLFDDIAGNFDDFEGLFDANDLATFGYYEFEDILDVNTAQTVYISSAISFYHIDYVNSFDLASGNFDDRIGDFDGDTSNYDQASVKLQIATTQDNPSGSPTWTNWEDFVATQRKLRAAKFRLIVETTDINVVPAVEEITVTGDLSDKIISGNDISFTGQQVVTFTTPFYTGTTPTIGVALTGLSSGDYYTITGKDNEGFTITVYDSTDTQLTTSVTMDYIAKGY